MPYHRKKYGHNKSLKSYFRFGMFFPIFQTCLVDCQTCANENNNDENLSNCK